MTKNPMQAYAELAESGVSPTQQAGRYSFQDQDESLIVPDILKKLDLAPHHRLLEIGCGPGNLLIPLSFLVAAAVGIDHAAIIGRSAKRFDDRRITWLPGTFPDVLPPGLFDRILVYSVIHYLEDIQAVQRFLASAVSLLASQGRMLVADVPNADRKRRFSESDFGKSFEAGWVLKKSAANNPADPIAVFEGVQMIGTLNDEMVLSAVHELRRQGYDAYLMPQPPELPMGHTREDILVMKP